MLICYNLNAITFMGHKIRRIKNRFRKRMLGLEGKRDEMPGQET
jgi:hypothetical protein